MVFLRARDLSVDFPLYHGSGRSLKKALLAKSTRGGVGRDALDRVVVRALHGLSFDIEEGERVGIVGSNGAGKTTLLKVLAGIYEPTQGRFFASGRVSALLDVFVGLNPEATGRENILLRGMHMDIRPRDMRRQVDAVATFSELGDYLDLPVRTYSAGMMVRLAFSVSTCIPPEILVMDEWLAAGDAHFLARAQQRMAEFVSSSGILILASHSMDLLRAWCTRGILLKDGEIVASGGIGEVIAEHETNQRSLDGF